jgi:hypothetical protein
MKLTSTNWLMLLGQSLGKLSDTSWVLKLRDKTISEDTTGLISQENFLVMLRDEILVRGSL